MTNFDLEAALTEIGGWMLELGDNLEDTIKYSVLEGVRDLILDNCYEDYTE